MRDGRQWDQTTLVAVDLELTGLDPTRDTIISFGAIPIQMGRVRLDLSTYRVVQSDIEPGAAGISVHEILPSDLTAAPSLDATKTILADSLGDHPLIVWTAWVETEFLARVLGGSGVTWSKRMVDVRPLAHRVPDCPATADLFETARALGVPFERTHHALWDAFLTAQVFLICAAKLGLTTIDDLFDAANPSSSFGSGRLRRRI